MAAGLARLGAPIYDLANRPTLERVDETAVLQVLQNTIVVARSPSPRRTPRAHSSES